MRKLSLDRVYGCSTNHRHGIIGLPQNRVAFIAGAYLVVLDCSSNEQRYLPFSSIEFLYLSPRGTWMGIIDRLGKEGETRLHIYSTQPIDLLSTIDSDRFGNFLSVTINNDETMLMILHDEPGYMLTIQDMRVESEEQHAVSMTDLASVRLVHGPVMNRMTKQEVIPRVEFISFCPHSSTLFCVTGAAIFKIFQIDQQSLHQQIVHFRAEFYAFTCHCWLDANSIVVATDHGHLFWIQDGSIRSDISLEESLFAGTHLSPKSLDRRQSSRLSSQPYLAAHDSQVNLVDAPIDVERASIVRGHTSHLNLSPTSKSLSESSAIYLDLLTSNEILPRFIASYQEYLLVFIPITDEPFFRLVTQHRLANTREYQIDLELHRVHKMAHIFDMNSPLIYLLTDRNQIFRYHINSHDDQIDFDEEHLYGLHAYSVSSIGLCTYKPWLVTLGADHWIRIFDYKDHHREILTKYIPDGAHVATDLDPYGLHLCLAMKNRFQLHLLANYELRLIHQYETRSIRNVVISHGGHLIAVISNNVIKIYSTVHFNLISQLRGHAGKIQQVLWCKNDSMLISCGTDGMIYTFNTLTGKCSSGDLRAIIPEIPGMREGEIITKQFRYLGVAATMDGQRIYAIASDSMIKIFSNTNLEREWPIENGFLPSAITLSKSERFLYVGMTHGIIRVYTLPFTLDAFVDVSAHSSTIRRLLVSADDQYLVSIAESAYILLFRQTTDLLNSMSSQYEFTHPTTVHVEIDMAQKPVRVLPTFEYILVTKSEFDEQRRKVKEIQARIDEFETENNLKLRSKEIAFSQQLHNYSKNFEVNIKQLFHAYEHLKTAVAKRQCQFLQDKERIEEQYANLEDSVAMICENEMIETLAHLERAQAEIEKLRAEYQQKTTATKEQEHLELVAIVNRINTTLQSKWRSAQNDYDSHQEKERHRREYIRQLELDVDDEIESMKSSYVKEIQFCNGNVQQLTISVSTLRKRYNAIIRRMETRDLERSGMENEIKELQNRQSDLMEQLDRFRSIIRKKEDRIGGHDIKLHRLQQRILHVEKRKYVLDYKTKSLMERIEPLDQEILQFKTNNQNLEQQLTNLKRQQTDLIQREKDYRGKLDQSSQQLTLARRDHQHLSKVIKRDKDIIKRAFDLVEISCTSIGSIETPRERLRKFIESVCHTIQNEHQTENQLEIEGFMKEWSDQRHWLLNHLQTLARHTEEKKQSLAHAQREHRKTLAPFINQLRDLRRSSDEMQKKVQKHWSTLKIKGTDQAEFLRQLSTIVHGNDKRHLLMEKLRQNELLIELREQEIQRLAAIVFRSERGSPCSETDPSRPVLTLAVQQANPSRHFRLADDLVDKVVLDGEARGKNK